MSQATVAEARERLTKGGAFAETVRAVRRVLTDPQGALGLFLVGVLVLAAILAPLLAPYNPALQTVGAQLHAPSRVHVFGTDELGRDLFSRALYGLRNSLVISSVAVAAGAFVGSLLGYVAGYVGGLAETVVMRLIDTLLAFPSLLAAIAIVTVLGVGMRNVILAIAIFNVPVFVRLSRAEVLAESPKDYVLAARSVGASDVRILLRHIIINTLRPLIVQVALSLSFAILAEAALSFLGLGVQPPAPSLGSLIETGRGYIYDVPSYPLLIGAVLASLMIGLNFLADSITYVTDPKRHG